MVFLSGGQIQGVAPDVLTETTPIFADASYYPTRDLELSGQFAAYGMLYRRQLWVYSVLTKVALSGARLPLKVYRRTPTGREEASDTPYGRLIAQPHPTMDPFLFWMWTMTTREVYGEALWVKVRRQSDNSILYLQPMHPTNTTIRRNKESGEVEYLFTSGTRLTSLLPPIPASDVIHFRGYNPEFSSRGMSLLEPLRMTLLNEDAARRATTSFWARGSRPSVALVHPKTLSQAAADRLKANWDSSHGGVDNMGGTAVLEEGMTPQVISLSAEEMQYIETRKLNREEVCAAADVPPPVVHILDKATYSNITEQMRSMYRDTMAPRLAAYESAIHHQLAPEYGADDLYAEFLIDEVLRGAFETRADAYQKAISAGWMTPREVRDRENLPDAGPAADQLYGNAALVPLGTRPPVLTGTPAPSDGVLVLGRAYPAPAQVRALMGRLGRKMADRKATIGQLTAEHRKVLVAVLAKQRAAAGDQGSGFTPDDWLQPLVDELLPLAEATAVTMGAPVARRFGASFDVAAATAWLLKNAELAAERINRSSADALTAAQTAEDSQAAVAAVFGEDRAARLADERVASVGNFAEHEGARQGGARVKVWTVNSGKPRASHAAMAGEAVPVSETFSNGLRWPHDPTGGADEVAGCTCTVDYQEG